MRGVRLRRGRHRDLLVGADGALDLVGIVLFGGKLQWERLLHVQRGCGETEGGDGSRERLDEQPGLFDKPDPVKTANVILMRLIRPSAGQARKIHFNRESAALINITYGRKRLKT